MKKYSIWKEDVKLSEFNKLSENKDVDVLIIGGGMTGINTMYQLRESSLEVLLVEQNKIGMGVTVNSTGKLTYLQEGLYEKIWKASNKDKVLEYLESQRDAIKIAVDIISKENIDCNLIEAPSYVYSNNDDEDERLIELKDFLNKARVNVIEGKSDLVKYKSMIGVVDTYLFHPLKYISGLVKVLDKNNIYEDTSIIKMEKNGDQGYICYTNNDKIIRAKRVVIASHYPYFNIPFLFPIKGSLEKSYISASKYKEDSISMIKYDKPIISIRSYLDYLIYLSNSRDISSKVIDVDHYKELLKKVKDLNLDPEYMWSNTDIMTNDGLPYIGLLADNLLIGTGYNTWGMTNGILAGKILTDILLNKENEYVDLFNPKRMNLGMIGGAINDSIMSANGYINGILTDSDKIKYEVVDNKEIAIYKDSCGEHRVYTKCPHMGCRLIFNEFELTWDCPCHASSFDIDGKCINGPSNKNISVDEKLDN